MSESKSFDGSDDEVDVDALKDEAFTIPVDGSVLHVMCFGRALSQEEISALYES